MAPPPAPAATQPTRPGARGPGNNTRRRPPKPRKPGVWVTGKPSGMSAAPIKRPPETVQALKAPDPRDAQYWMERAKLFNQQQQQLADLQKQQEWADLDYQEAVRRLTERYQRQRQATTTAANRAGLFYSGQLGKWLGDIDVEESRRLSDLRQDYERRSEARKALIAKLQEAIQQGRVIGEEDIFAAAVQRAAQADMESPPEATPVGEEVERYGEPGWGYNEKTGEQYKVGRVGEDVFHVYGNRIVGLGVGKGAVKIIGAGINPKTGEAYQKVRLPNGDIAHVYASGRVVGVGKNVPKKTSKKRR